VTVTPAPLGVTASASPTTGDAPLLATLTAHPTGGTAPFSYAWTLGDGSTSTQAGFSHTYGAGLYTIGLTITDAVAKTAYTTIYLTVYPSLSVTTTAAPVAGNAPLQVAFTATASGGLAPFTYIWQFGDGTSGAGGGTVHSYGSGTFDAAVTVHDAAGGAWTGTVASISAAAPASSSSGGGTGGGTPGSSSGAQPPTSPPSTQTPAPSASPSAGTSPSPTPAGTTAPRGSGDGGNGPLLLTILGSVLATGVGGSLFAMWRRRRLR
jgi:PKD repeat protein